MSSWALKKRFKIFHTLLTLPVASKQSAKDEIKENLFWHFSSVVRNVTLLLSQSIFFPLNHSHFHSYFIIPKHPSLHCILSTRKRISRRQSCAIWSEHESNKSEKITIPQSGFQHAKMSVHMGDKKKTVMREGGSKNIIKNIVFSTPSRSCSLVESSHRELKWGDMRHDENKSSSSQ